MGVYTLLFCVSCLYAASGKNTVDSSSDPGSVQNMLDFNYVLKKLFDEMNATMADMIGRKSDGEGNIDSSKLLTKRIKQIFMSSQQSRKLKNGSNSTPATEGIGVFKKIFNRMARGINTLFRSTKEDNESKRYIKGITPVKRKDSIQPLLERLKKLDVAGKRASLYYEDEESDNKIKTKSMSTISPLPVHTIDSVHGTGPVFSDDTEGSDDGSAEDASGSGNGPPNNVIPTNVKTTKSKGYQDIVNFIARDEQ